MTISSSRRLLAAASLLAGPSAFPLPPKTRRASSSPTPAGTKRPGTYTYPTDAVYKPGAFDITEFGGAGANQTEFRITVRTRIEDPGTARRGAATVLGADGLHPHRHRSQERQRRPGRPPGTNVRFAEDEAWDRVIIVSPQGATRVNSEIGLKAAQWKDKIIVPKVTRAQGKTLIAVVDNAQLGGPPQTTWGYQVLMQSNEGFPAKTDLLTRKVNEFEGQHRFGGGSDYDNDPHVMDILVPSGGDPAKKQYEILSKYNHNTKEPKPEDLAVVPMVYPNAGK
jgi:carbohydrate-binding DOMON domain-containing protein